MPASMNHPYLNLFRAAHAVSVGLHPQFPLDQKEIEVVQRYFPELSNMGRTEKIPFNAEFLISSLDWSLDMYERLEQC